METSENERSGITIKVDGYRADRIQEELDSLVRHHVQSALSEKVLEATTKHVKALVDDITRDRLKAEIDKLLDEGWVKTDEWGNAKGVPITLRDRVRGVFERRTGSYSSDPSCIDKWVQDSVNYRLGEVLKEELVSAKARLKAAFDEALQAKFSATIREALGLK